MYRLAATVVLSSAAFAQNAPDPEIVRAAKSPYGLARYIDSHSGFEWGPLWRVLALSASIIPCGHAGVCSTELIQVLDPAQTILVIDMQYTSEVYVRYLGSESSGWRRVGAYEAHIRNYPRRHGIVRVGGKPFLQVVSQGVSGSDVSSEVESWFDLSQPELSPAFSFTSQGHQHRLGFGVSRTIHASASPEGIGQTESIRLIVQVRYSGFDINLGEGDYSATYERLPRNKNFTLSKARSITSRSSITNTAFEDLVDLDQGPTNEQLLIYALPRLKEVASTGKAPEKEWLRFMLSNCKDTPERRTLMELLTGH